MDEKPVEAWLNAESAESWRETIRNGYSRAYVLFALMESGALDALKKSGDKGMTAEELAAECNLDLNILDNILTYMWLSDVVMTKVEGRYKLTEKAAWIYEPKMMHILYNNVGSYSICLAELLPTLRKQKTYGKDFLRNGEYLAIGTRNITVESHPGIVKAVEKSGAKVVADLGCGSAHAIVKFCKANPAMKGVGIDLSAGALEEAKRVVAAAGMTDRIRLVQGNVGDPESWAKEAADVELFVTVAVLHEILRDGEEAVIRVLRKMKELFPGRTFVVAEFNKRDEEEFPSIPLDFRYRWLFYQYLMHPLSAQGLLPQRRWIQIFESLGIQVQSVEPFNLDVYVLKL